MTRLEEIQVRHNRHAHGIDCGVTRSEIDWLISQAEKVQELEARVAEYPDKYHDLDADRAAAEAKVVQLEAEVERLKSIIQLDHDVHGEDQQTITDLSRKCELLETKTKEIAASMAKDIMRELVPGIAKTASDAAVGAVEQVTKGKWWAR